MDAAMSAATAELKTNGETLSTQVFAAAYIGVDDTGAIFYQKVTSSSEITDQDTQSPCPDDKPVLATLHSSYGFAQQPVTEFLLPTQMTPTHDLLFLDFTATVGPSPKPTFAGEKCTQSVNYTDIIDADMDANTCNSYFGYMDGNGELTTAPAPNVSRYAMDADDGTGTAWSAVRTLDGGTLGDKYQFANYSQAELAPEFRENCLKATTLFSDSTSSLPSAALQNSIIACGFVEVTRNCGWNAGNDFADPLPAAVWSSDMEPAPGLESDTCNITCYWTDSSNDGTVCEDYFKQPGVVSNNITHRTHDMINATSTNTDVLVRIRQKGVKAGHPTTSDDSVSIPAVFTQATCFGG
jgi:hypothetical protein